VAKSLSRCQARAGGIVEHLERCGYRIVSAMRIEVKSRRGGLGTALPDFPLALLLAKLHRLRPAQKPIDRNVKPVCYLSQPVNVKRAEARVFKVDSAPAAKPNA
jgi:hypothetical protein